MRLADFEELIRAADPGQIKQAIEAHKREWTRLQAELTALAPTAPATQRAALTVEFGRLQPVMYWMKLWEKQFGPRISESCRTKARDNRESKGPTIRAALSGLALSYFMGEIDGKDALETLREIGSQIAVIQQEKEAKGPQETDRFTYRPEAFEIARDIAGRWETIRQENPPTLQIRKQWTNTISRAHDTLMMAQRRTDTLREEDALFIVESPDEEAVNRQLRSNWGMRLRPGKAPGS